MNPKPFGRGIQPVQPPLWAILAILAFGIAGFVTPALLLWPVWSWFLGGLMGFILGIVIVGNVLYEIERTRAR